MHIYIIWFLEPYQVGVINPVIQMKKKKLRPNEVINPVILRPKVETRSG